MAGGQLPQIFDLKNLTMALPDAGEAWEPSWELSERI